MNQIARSCLFHTLRVSILPVLSAILVMMGTGCGKEAEATGSGLASGPASAPKPRMVPEDELDYQKWISVVKLGQTEEEVQSLLGKPAIITRQGKGLKGHYERPDIVNRITMHVSGALGATITFVDGKVTSIEPVLRARDEPAPGLPTEKARPAG